MIWAMAKTPGIDEQRPSDSSSETNPLATVVEAEISCVACGYALRGLS
jgi:hypothetical protein